MVLALAGCGSPPAVTNASKPNFGPPIQDVRTEATITQMENDYIAAKNSPPPNPRQAAAMKHQEEAAQAEKARAAKAAEDQPKTAPKAPEQPKTEETK